MSSPDAWTLPPGWPPPEPAARALSERLLQQVKDAIDRAGGYLAFARYMELALYAPGLGYYSAGAQKLGAPGDFVTAPEISPLFAHSLAQSCAPLLAQLDDGVLFELGAGSGVLAAQLLAALAEQGQLPQQYWILEPAADLRQRQQQYLAATVPQWLSRIVWLDAPPSQAWRGVLLANEVLDALPVTCFAWQAGQVFEQGVSWQAGRLVPAQQPAAADLARRVSEWAERYAWPARYRSELRPYLLPWLQSVSEQLTQGACLFIDYGYAAHEYYHAQRSSGTLMCHYRHRAHADPLLLPGLQDITAYVDFTAVAEAGVELGWQLAGYTTQAHFLLQNDIEARLLAAQQTAPQEALRLAAQLKTLLLPGEMGERFKCLLLMRGLDASQADFGVRDLRDRL